MGSISNMLTKRNSNLKIVVVDDSNYLRKNIVNTLEDEGFNVVGQAGNAEEGIKLCVTIKANLFIIDILMPKRSGLDLLSAMFENKFEGHAIIMSSLSTDKIIFETFRSGAVDFLRKPFGRNELIRSVENIDLRIKKDKN